MQLLCSKSKQLMIWSNTLPRSAIGRLIKDGTGFKRTTMGQSQFQKVQRTKSIESIKR
jgi:hypothetical protein